MTKVNMHEAKTNLSKLVEQALAGEEVVLAKNGEALVRLVPVATEVLRPIGLHRAAMSDEEAEEALRPLSEEELGFWTSDNLE